eukprot:9504039-Pyramimonas_sp.AAC.1
MQGLWFNVSHSQPTSAVKGQFAHFTTEVGIVGSWLHFVAESVTSPQVEQKGKLKHVSLSA